MMKKTGIIFLLSILGLAISAAPHLELTGLGCLSSAKKNYEVFGCDNSNDESCLCKNDNFLQTVILCVKNEEDDILFKYGKKAVKRACNEASGKRLVTNSKLRQALKSANEKIIHKRDIVSNDSNYILEVRSDKYEGMDDRAIEIMKDAKMKSHLSDTYGTNMGYGILGYMLLVFILRSISNLAYKALPVVLNFFDGKISRKIRRYALLPATFRKHHSNPFYIKGYTFNIPTREHTIITTVYVILNVVFCFVGYQSFTLPPDAKDHLEPEYLYEYQGNSFLVGQIAQRVGIIPTIQFPLLILFGGRNNFLIWITGWPLDTFNIYHKWFGRIIILQLFAHAVVYSYSVSDSYAEMWSATYWKWGAVAFICGAFILGQSVHYFRALRYELFLVLHILLAIFFTVGAWWHLIEMFYYQFVYAAVAVWALDRFIRLVRIVISGVTSKADIKFHEGDIIEIKMNYSRLWKFYPGSYVFVHFLRWNRFWQNHPFTLVESPREEDNGKLVIFAKAKDGITRHTKEYLLKQEQKSAQIGVWIEGPYGPKHPVHKYDEVVMFAGGIGITGVYCYAQSIRKNSTRQQKIYLNWVIPDTKPLDWFSEYLEYLREDERFEITIHINKNRDFVEDEPDTSSIEEFSDEEIEREQMSSGEKKAESINSGSLNKSFGRPVCYQIIQDHLKNAQGSVSIVVCGPGTMNDEIRKSISENMEDAKGRVDYFEESFSW